MEEKYYCSKCQIVSSFDSRRKTHPCWHCKNEMRYLGMNRIVNGTLYNAYVPYDEKELNGALDMLKELCFVLSRK